MEQAAGPNQAAGQMAAITLIWAALKGAVQAQALPSAQQVGPGSKASRIRGEASDKAPRPVHTILGRTFDQLPLTVYLPDGCH